MAIFTGQTPASDYGCILNVGVTGSQVGLTNVLQQVQDAYGNPTPISLSTIAFNIARSGFTWYLDSVAVTAQAVDINSMCQPDPIALGTGSLTIPVGTTGQRPSVPLHGMTRFNSTTGFFEGYDGSSWNDFDTGGTVNSIAAVVNGVGMTITGSPITTSGTFTFTLNQELQGLSQITGLGFVTRTNNSGGYSARTFNGSANQITVTNGDGTSGDPIIAIANTYAGQTSITTLGTITIGTWNATAITVPYGGTGLTTTTAYGLITGGTTATGAFQNAGTGTSGQIYVSGGAAALGTWQTLATGVSSVSGTLNRITVSPTTGDCVVDIAATYVGQTSITTLGTIGTGVWQGTNVGLGFGGTNASLTASNGGIFYSTATAGAILSGTVTANQVLLSGASSAPAWSTATYPVTTTINQLLYSSSNNTITGLATTNSAALSTNATGVPTWLALTDGQIVIGSSIGAPAAAQITGSGGITVTSGHNTINISGSGSGGGWAIVNQNTNTVTVAPGNAYMINNGASLVTLTLPASPTAGDAYKIVGDSSGGWTVVYNANQFIELPGGTLTTTTTGSVSSNTAADCIVIRYTETANKFIIEEITGTPAYV